MVEKEERRGSREEMIVFLAEMFPLTLPILFDCCVARGEDKRD